MRRCTPRKQMCLEVEALECRDAPSTLAVHPRVLHAQHRGSHHHLARRKHHPKAVAHAPPKGVVLVPGPAGPQGPSGIVSSAFAAGQGTPPPLGGIEVFVSPTVTVTVAAGQRVFVSASVSLLNPLPPSVTTDDDVRFWIAYQPAGGTLTNATPFGQDESIQGEETNLTSLSAVLSGLAPGTYQVGLAGQFESGTSFFLNALNGSASALVFQGP